MTRPLNFNSQRERASELNTTEHYTRNILLFIKEQYITHNTDITFKVVEHAKLGSGDEACHVLLRSKSGAVLWSVGRYIPNHALCLEQ